MDKKQQPEALTKREQAWLRHLQDCEAQGICKTAYGQAHGIKPKRLYHWQWLLRQKGYLGGEVVKHKPKPEAGAWVPVKIKPATSTPSGRCQMRLPNGIELEWERGYAIADIIQIVAGIQQR